MTTLTCADCTTPYSPELQQCPHCSSPRHTEDGVTVRRLPTFIQVSCSTTDCPVNGVVRALRLNSPQLGLVELPSLHCSACGGQVSIPWPPKDEPMPKISRRGDVSVATNARKLAEPSPDALASQPLVGAEADQGRPIVEDVPVSEPPVSVPAVDALTDGTVVSDDTEADPYAGMTLTELRTAADDRGVVSYGTKAQIADRLREADAA